MKKGFTGCRHSDATREKMRQAKLGRRLDEATKRKIRATQKRHWRKMKEALLALEDRAA